MAKIAIWLKFWPDWQEMRWNHSDWLVQSCRSSVCETVLELSQPKSKKKNYIWHLDSEIELLVGATDERNVLTYWIVSQCHIWNYHSTEWLSGRVISVHLYNRDIVYVSFSQHCFLLTPMARLDCAVSCWRQVEAWPPLTDMECRYLTRKYQQRSFFTRYWVSI